MPSELERLRHYYLAAAGVSVSDAPGVHPMQKMVPKKSSIRAPADDEDQVKALLEELNDMAFVRHRSDGRRLDLALSIRRKAQHVAVEAERSILEGYHGGVHAAHMPEHVRERLIEIGHLLGPPTQDRYPRAAAAM